MIDKSNNRIELYPLGKIKDNIIKILAQNEDIADLMLGENYPNRNSYQDYDILKGSDELGLDALIEDTLEKEIKQDSMKTYICLDSIVQSINGKIKLIVVKINVFTHLSLIKLSTDEKEKFNQKGYYGNRIDCLIDTITRCIDESNKNMDEKEENSFGIGNFTLSPNFPVTIYQPSNKEYYGKSLTFYVNDF
jgi:hypothetical protein